MNTRYRWIGAALIVLILTTVFVWEGFNQPSAPQTELAAGNEPAGRGAADDAEGGSQTDSGSPTAPGQSDESADGGTDAEASGDPSGEPGSDAEAANKAGATDGTSAVNTEGGAEGAGTSGGTADTSSPDGASASPSGDGSGAAAPSTSGTAGAGSAGGPSTGSTGNSADSGSAPAASGSLSSSDSSASSGKSPSAGSSSTPSAPAASGSGAKSPAKDSTPAQQPAKGGTSQSPAKGESPAAGGGKDKYQTEPVPDGKAQPVEWQDAEVDKTKTRTATLSVSATTLLDKLDKLDSSKHEVLPEDGIIYKARKVTFYEGESVFDVLLREMKKSKIHMEFEMTPLYNSNYIEGINNLYEFDAGELSGWMYKVNGWFPNYGSSRYALEDGDVVEWVYTTDLGRDVGGDSSAGGRS